MRHNTPSVRAAGWVLAVLMVAAAQAPALAGRAEHVVVVVWDGLRPDCVNERNTPTLYKLGREGVVFARHHSVYPSSTEVNGAALATGTYPRHSGIVANREYRPEIDALQAVDTASDYAAWVGDRLRGGAYVGAPTLAEAVRKAGRRAAVAGTKQVAFMWDRSARDAADAGKGIALVGGMARPFGTMDQMQSSMGPIPPTAASGRRANARQDEWTTRAMIQRLWAGGVPDFSVLWLSEPDYAQHGSGPGSKVVKAALQSSDSNLGLVLEALDGAKVRDKTDVIVVSDHGFSTIMYTVNVIDDLWKSGISAAKDFRVEPAEGEVMVVGNGGSVCFYVAGHDQAVIRQVVEAMQNTEYAGVIFTRKEMPGTFTLEQAGIDTKDAPDVMMSLRWWNDTSATGLPGMVVADGSGLGHGQGMHASLSPFDMHATLVGSGPDFRKGMVDELPSGSADVKPTVLWLLGIKAEGTVDGRVLGEALVDGPAVNATPETKVMETKATVGELTWTQYLKVTRLGSWVYYEEGNGKVSRQ